MIRLDPPLSMGKIPSVQALSQHSWDKTSKSYREASSVCGRPSKNRSPAVRSWRPTSTNMGKKLCQMAEECCCCSSKVVWGRTSNFIRINSSHVVEEPTLRSVTLITTSFFYCSTHYGVIHNLRKYLWVKCVGTYVYVGNHLYIFSRCLGMYYTIQIITF